MHADTEIEEDRQDELADLRARLEDAEDALRAIRAGEVDALVISTPEGPKVFTLQGVDAESSRHRGEMLAQVGDAVIAVDADERVTFLNAAAERLYAVNAAEMLGRKLDDIHSCRWPDPAAQAAASATLDACGAWRGENLHITRDGRELAVESSISRLSGINGSDRGRLAVIREVTERKRTEEALRQAHNKLEGVLNSITDGMFILDRNWRYTYFNKQGASLIGMTPDDLIGKNVWELFPEARNSLFFEAYHRAMDSGEPLQFEEYYPEPLNMWLECNCYPSADDMAVYFRDISARKQAAATLEQNARLFVTLVEQAPMGVYVVDSDFKIKQINSEALPTFENIHPLVGRDFEEVLEILWGPETGGRLAAIFRHTLATGERYSSKSFSERRSDTGEDRAYEWETQRVTLPDGRHGVVCYFNDVTDPKRAEWALRASEERTRLATAATGVGIWEWNVATATVRWDAQMFNIYGMAPTADGFVAYQAWREAVLPEDLEEQEARLRDHLRRAVQGRREFRIQRRDTGEVRHILAIETVRRCESGQVQSLVGTNLDVTERKLAEQALHQADRRKNEFLATLSHELRNPLSPLSCGLEIMRMAGDSGPAVTKAREIMERQLGQMVRLVDDLLDVSRITHGKLTLHKARVDLAAVLQSAVETSQGLIHEMEQQLELVVPDAPLVLEADFTRLAQVFLNLLNNAAKYSERGGHITVIVEPQEHEVLITVRDSGIGISAEQIPHLFELFSQAEQSSEKSHGGLGIGLALVQRLVEMHHGTVKASSRGPGMGSDFIVRLPLAPPITAETPPATETLPPITPAGTGRILVVDDNADAAMTLKAVLEITGYTVAVAHDGAEAVALAAEFLPALILMDIGMPVLNGYDACRRIRDLPSGRDIVIIALTGWGQEEDRASSADAGFDHHLVKPVDLALTQKLISNSLASRRWRSAE